MIKPVNQHILVEPLVHKEFVQSAQRETYEEIGLVVDFDEEINQDSFTIPNRHTVEITPEQMAAMSSGNVMTPYYDAPVPLVKIRKGDKVYFDAWMVAKFPKGETGENLWLVKWEDVRAVEHD